MQAKLVLKKDNTELLIDLYEKEAPGTVANFVKLIESGFYNGLTFHRVIPGFVAQGGCPLGTGTGGPGWNIKCETVGNPHIHEPGALSMAHAGKDTGGSQFFIAHDYFPHLDGVHTVFGKVISKIEDVLNIKQGDKIKEMTIVSKMLS